MTSAGIEDLYKNYGLLADAGENISQNEEAYKNIIKASKGSTGEKKLAPGFITKFLRHFPSLHNEAIDAMVDLIEDEDVQIRRLAIKSLPDICRGATDTTLCTKVADLLTQLLLSEDSVDLGLVKTSMSSVLLMDAQSAMAGIFDQICGEDESIREKGLEYISTSLVQMRHKLFIPHPENEKFLVEMIKKVLLDVTGEEFETLMEVLSRLNYITTDEGSQQVAALISDQAELNTDFQAEDEDSVDKFISCFRQAIKFSKVGSVVSPFIEYLSCKILPSLSKVGQQETRQELLQLLAEGCLYPVSEEATEKCLEPVFTALLGYMPLPPADEGEQPKLEFSVVECLLFSFHHLVKGRHVAFLTADENTDRLKDFRQRLQYFARGSQTYHAQLTAALKGKNALELKDEQNKLRSIALKTTANITALIKDFFHNPPALKTVVLLSWGAKKSDSAPGGQPRKRLSSEGTGAAAAGATPAKRKPSPIRFDAGPTSASSPAQQQKRESQSMYTVPRDRYSKKLANGANFESYQGGGGGGGGWRGGRGGRGRGFRGGGGRGFRGGRGRRRGAGSWRV